MVPLSYRLLATDIDLTLTRTDRTVSERTAGCIRRAFRRGAYVTLCTGRLPRSAEPYRGLITGSVPLILGNGAILQDALTGRTDYERLMPPEDARSVMAWGAGRGEGMFVWTRSGLYADRTGPAFDSYGRLVHVPPVLMRDFSEPIGQGVYKVMIIGEPARIAEDLREALSCPPGRVTAFTSDAGALEIVPEGVDKGTGLQKAAELLGIPREQVIAVGDGMNDVPMLRWAGLGCAMANAAPEVRAEADVIAPSCDEDGLAWVLEKYLLEEQA